MNTQTSFPEISLAASLSNMLAKRRSDRLTRDGSGRSPLSFTRWLLYHFAYKDLRNRLPNRRRQLPSQPQQGGTNSVTSSASPNLEVLSDTQGVDFGPYLKRVSDAVRRNWYTLVPEEARAPELKRGKVVIEFAILPHGKVAGMKVAASSGDVLLDRAAWGGITASNPFAPLPEEFHGPFVALRFRFFYNPQKAGLGDPSKTESH